MSSRMPQAGPGVWVGRVVLFPCLRTSLAYVGPWPHLGTKEERYVIVGSAKQCGSSQSCYCLT